MSMGALNLVPNAVGRRPPQIVYGTVSETQPLPASFNDPLHVVEPWNPNHFHTITSFPAIHGASLPLAGADVVLIMDNTRTWRCIWWAGTHS